MDRLLTVQCQVCLEKVPANDSIRCPGGGHAICSVDVQKFFDRVVEGSDPWPPKCCGDTLSTTICSEFLKHETLEGVFQLLKAKTDSAMEDESQRQYDEQDQLFVHESIRNGDLWVMASPYYSRQHTDPHCHRQICPNCTTRIYRIEGCSHMKCRVCKTHFCYDCGSVWSRCICWKEPEDTTYQPAGRILQHVDLRQVRRTFPVNAPQDPAWSIINANVGRQNGFDRDPAMCRHEARLQHRVPSSIRTNCCALDTERLRCRLCGFHHCRGCRFQPQLTNFADVDVNVDASSKVATTG